MQNRVSPSNNPIRRIIIIAAAVFLILILTAAAVFFYHSHGWFTIRDERTGELCARYLVRDNDTFSVQYIHSVNKSPVTNIYALLDHTIYVEKTVYYGFGAGMLTELEEGQTLEYGEDGSMIVSGFHRELPNLLYIVGTISDHILVINDGDEISLRDLCGKNALVRFSYEKLF